MIAEKVEKFNPKGLVLRAVFFHKFNPIKSTCFKVISQLFLGDAKAWSDTGKKHASFVANEFAD